MISAWQNRYPPGPQQFRKTRIGNYTVIGYPTRVYPSRMKGGLSTLGKAADSLEVRGWSKMQDGCND
jgi:hypothetical protein